MTGFGGVTHCSNDGVKKRFVYNDRQRATGGRPYRKLVYKSINGTYIKSFLSC